MDESEYGQGITSEAQRQREEDQQAAYDAYMNIWTPQADAYYEAYRQGEQSYDLQALQNIMSTLNGTEFHSLLNTSFTQALTELKKQGLSASQVEEIINTLIHQHILTDIPNESSSKAALTTYQQTTNGTFHPKATDHVLMVDFLTSEEMLVALQIEEEIITNGVLNEPSGVEEVPLLTTRLTQYSLIRSGEEVGAIPILETQNFQARRDTSQIPQTRYTYQGLQQGKTLLPLPNQAAEMTRTVRTLPLAELFETMFPDRDALGTLQHEGLNPLQAPRQAHVQLYIGKQFSPPTTEVSSRSPRV